MAVNPMAGGAAAMAGGAMPPQQGMPPQGGAPMAGGPPAAGGASVQQIMEALKQILPQVVDEKGYVNMDRLITMWPQISQIPFQAVMQLIQQTPDLLTDLIAQYGLAGIIVQNRVISADELAALGQRGGR